MSHLTEAVERLRILVNDPTHALTAEWLADHCGCDPQSMRLALAGELDSLPDGNHQFLFELDKAIRNDPSRGARLDDLVAELPAGRPRKHGT